LLGKPPARGVLQTFGMNRESTPTERDPQTSAIIAAAIEVHRLLGRGFLEYVYRTPLELELIDRGIPFTREAQYPIVYKGRRTGIVFRVDLVCYGEVIVELKAMKELGGAERAQTINYLRASGLKRALLLNFGTPLLSIERFANFTWAGRPNGPPAERSGRGAERETGQGPTGTDEETVRKI
jgi:GxxExxY protein